MVRYKVGDQVERNIEGMWFVAVVERCSSSNDSVDIKYLDDGNREDGVHTSEIRKHASSNSIGDENLQNRQKTTLARPLAGLVEDDYEVRNAAKPTILLHENGNIDEAIILNGAENRLAAGGGLRALRYLKK
jgi:hypothetical protein